MNLNCVAMRFAVIVIWKAIVASVFDEIQLSTIIDV